MKICPSINPLLAPIDVYGNLRNEKSTEYDALYFADGAWGLDYDKNVSKVVEGCNAISIAILFVSFIVAFAGKLKPTFLYALSGIFIIHVCNILRIGLLSVLFYEIPSYKTVLHGVVFPFILYSIVFILWIIWTHKFSKYATKNTK